MLIGSNFGRVERQIGIEVLIVDQRRRRRGQQRVAVGRCLVDDLRADIAGRARVVLDDDRLAPFAREPIRHDARHGIGGPAGRERHDDLHGVIGIGLRLRLHRRRGNQRDGRHRRIEKSPLGQNAHPGILRLFWPRVSPRVAAECAVALPKMQQRGEQAVTA